MLDAQTAQSDPLIGTIVSERYRILRVLGEGGMGMVYEAEQQFLGRTVAVKTLHGMFARKPEIVARFQNEALAAARVRNPHIVELLELGRLDDGALFIAMEMLHGRELSRLFREGPLPIGRAVRIAMQLCDALIDVHAAGIIHRDLKPANIFLVRSGTDEDFVKVLDFGISKVTEAEGTPDFTRTRSVLGTPHYMAPEQIGNARKVDARSDLYAVGGILYRALAGRTAFTEKEFTELAIQVKTLPPPDLRGFRADLPEGLVQVVHSCLAKSPEQRPADARVLRAMLEPFAHLDDAPRVSVVSVAVSELFQSAGSGLRPGSTGTVVADGPSPPPMLPPQVSHPSQVSYPGSLTAPVVVQAGNNGVMVLVSVLATILVIGGLAIAAYVVTRDPAVATTPTPAAPAPRTAIPTAPPPSLPGAPATPPPARAAIPRAPTAARDPATPTVVRPTSAAVRTPTTGRERVREPAVNPVREVVAPAPQVVPAAPPPQGVLVHTAPSNPF